VVVALDGLKVGMIVDAVTEVLRVPQDAFESPPLLVTSVDKSYITGIAKVGERLIILLDISSVLEM
jgi:purine-binding chemotaxis protein CheW